MTVLQKLSGRIQDTRGFTLIEVMVVAAILGIISAVAWHAYQNQVLTGRRRDAISSLLAASHALKQCKYDNGSYTNCLLSAAPAALQKNGPYVYSITAPGGTPGIPSKDGLYTIVGAIIARNTPGDGFTLTATKILVNDPDCTSLTLDDLDRKGYTGAAGSNVHRCWGD